MNLNALARSSWCVFALAVHVPAVFAQTDVKSSKTSSAAKAGKDDAADEQKSESKSRTKSESKADAKAKADAKPESRVEAKSEGKSGGKSEAKSEGKADGKAEGKAEGKSAGKSEQKGKGELGGSTLIRELTVEQLQQALSNYQKTGSKLKIDVGAAGHRPTAGRPPASPVSLASHVSHASHASHASSVRADGPLAVAHKSGSSHSEEVFDPNSSRDYIKARAVALTEKMAKANHSPGLPADNQSAPGHGASGPAPATAHWGYDGSHGPQAWAQMKPEFGTCATGKRQSPIHIEDNATLQGPAEALQMNYLPSSGTVINNGHTIQVDVNGENTLTVRGTTYKLVQFHAHHPAEERVNNKTFSMVIHLVHRSNDGKLAVIAVLLDPGPANPFIQKVWTHMPLDVQDKVRMPADYLNLTELLPVDRRYYQFMGSLTTPPCTEGVLWMVLKQPVTLSREQLRVFAQLFPNNARPVQPLQGRVVRNAE